jgi:hypothetical protein
VGRGRSRPWVALALTLALVLGAAVAVLALTRGGEESARPGPTSAAGGAQPVDERARDRAIRAVLDRRAAAVLDRDREAFLADVDQRDAEFRAAQEQLFDNLEQVDFASWEYELIGRDYDRPDLAGTYDTAYHLPALLLHYAIEGFDVAPVARPQVLTFVQRGDRWLVASDTDADSDLPETGHADPWDRRAVVAGEGRRVLVLADAEDRNRLRSLVRVSDQAVRRVAQMWPEGWRRKVVVVAVRDQQLIETYFRTALQSSEDVAAIAVPAYDVVPGWSPPRDAGEEPPGPRSRVILNPRYFDPDDDDNTDLLTHEVTHVATQARTLAGAPTWLSEGIAEYTAYRYLRPFSVDLPASLTRQVEAGSVDLPTYDFYQRDVAANYLAGFLACAYVADEYGEDVLRRLYDRLARTPNEIQTLQRQERAFRSMLGVSPEQLSRDVADYARTVSG